MPVIIYHCNYLVTSKHDKYLFELRSFDICVHVCLWVVVKGQPQVQPPEIASPSPICATE